MSGLVGIMGWLDNRWVRQPLLLGPSETLSEDITENNAIVGHNYLYGTVTPVGEIWVVTSLSARNANTSNADVSMGINTDGKNFACVRENNIAVNAYHGFTTYQVLFPTDKVFARFRGCVAGDDILLRYTGFKVLTGAT